MNLEGGIPLRTKLDEVILRMRVNGSYNIKKKISEVDELEFKEKYNDRSLFSIKDELVSEIALYLWKSKRFDEIEKYKELLLGEEKENYATKDFVSLSNIYKEMLGVKTEISKKILYAKGFAEIFAYKEAIELAEELLSTQKLNRKKEIKLREELELWYMESEHDKIAEKDNYLKLLTLLPQNSENYKKFFEIMSSRFNEKEIKIAVEILKKTDNPTYWKWLQEGTQINEKTFIHIYEAVEPENLYDDNLYLWMLDYYIEYDINKAEKLLDKIKDICKIDDLIIKKYEIKILVENKRYEEAIKLISLVSEKNEDDEVKFYLGYIYIVKEEYQNAINELEKIDSFIHEGLLVQYKILCYLELSSINTAINVFAKWYYKEKYCYNYIETWIRHSCFPVDFMVRCLEKIKSKEPDKYENISGYTIYHFFNITENIRDRGKIRYDLIRLYLLTNNIKYILKIDPEQVKEVYHYSKIYSLKYLPRYSNEVGGDYFRLSNIAYLNDPSEGMIFFEILGGIELEKSINDVYSKIFSTDVMEYKNKFLASFSLKRDFLPMWVQYSDDGRGCCYAIDIKDFSSYDDVLEHHILGDEYNRTNNLLYNNRENYVLYRVYYYNSAKSDNDDEILKICDEIRKLLIDMKNSLNIKKVESATVNILDEIRYLFKDVAYCNEEEVRILCTDYYNEKKINTHNNLRVPHFYLELETDLHFNEIILGPKVEDSKELSTYLSCCRNVDTVSKSKIKYV